MEALSEKRAVLFSKNKNNDVGIITLNSPQTLNALDLEMIDLISKQLHLWKSDPLIKIIIIEGSGNKAFCAGGDIVQLYKNIKQFKEEGSPDPSESGYVYDFFTKEYQLDYLIHTYPIPIIVLASGIVMGGGIGIMNGARYRVVTETTKLAMPEITIGLYPDVGGTYFLSRMADHLGKFLALTGARINGDDALYLGLANFFIPQAQIFSLKEKICALPFGNNPLANNEMVERILTQMMDQSRKEIPEGEIRKNHQFIKEQTSFENLKDLHRHWMNNNFNSYSEWMEKSISTYRKGSPASAIIIFEQMKRGQRMLLDEVFKTELILSINFSKIGNFQEGVRALLIEKDQQPNFNPRNLESLSPEDTQKIIDAHFKSPWERQNHPFEFKNGRQGEVRI